MLCIPAICCQALAVERACIFLAAVALSFVVFFRGRVPVVAAQYPLVVRLDDLGDVQHAAVADFHRVAVENLVKFRAWQKMFADESEELLANRGLDVVAVRWVEPHDVAFLLPFFVGRFSVGLVLAEKVYFLGVAAGLQGCVVQRGGLIECSLVTGSICDPAAASGYWDVAQNRRGGWMIGGRTLECHLVS